MKKEIKLAILETGQILAGQTASGDRWLEKISQYLDLDRYHFLIIIPKIGVKHWRESGLKAKYYPLPATPFDNQINPMLIFLSYLSRALSALKTLGKITEIDIIYSSTEVLPDILPAYLFKKRHPKIIWVAQLHHLVSPPSNRPGNWLVNSIAYLLQRISLFLLRDSDLILLNNLHLYSQLFQMGFSQKKLKVLGAGIDYDKITQGKIDPRMKAYQGVYLGRLHQTKGLFDLVLVWREVTRVLPKATLAVIGQGPENVKKLLKKQIKISGLEKNIKLLGFLKHNERLFSLLKKAGVFLFTDHEAGWGLAPAEAMACGLPVVGYDIGVLGDVFKKGYLTTPSFDQNLFAQKIIFLLKNEEERKKIAHEALSQARNLDWHQTAVKFTKILEELTR